MKSPCIKNNLLHPSQNPLLLLSFETLAIIDTGKPSDGAITALDRSGGSGKN